MLLSPKVSRGTIPLLIPYVIPGFRATQSGKHSPIRRKKKYTTLSLFRLIVSQMTKFKF
jgi:hypothetical protein